MSPAARAGTFQQTARPTGGSRRRAGAGRFPARPSARRRDVREARAGYGGAGRSRLAPQVSHRMRTAVGNSATPDPGCRPIITKTQTCGPGVDLARLSAAYRRRAESVRLVDTQKGRHMVRALAGLIVLGLVSTAAPAAADAVPGVTITFDDLTDTATFSTSDPTLAIGSCSGEHCMAGLIAPVGATGAGGSSFLNIGEPSGFPPFVVSDGLIVTVFAPGPGLPPSVTVAFNSDPDPNGGACPAPPNGCTLFETGGLQVAGHVTWSDSRGTPLRVDTIQFCSDVDGVSSTCGQVPEPATLLLLGSGLAGLAGWIGWRKPNRRGEVL
jgi:PEP-CTERM motif-containing protein